MDHLRLRNFHFAYFIDIGYVMPYHTTIPYYLHLYIHLYTVKCGCPLFGVGDIISHHINSTISQYKHSLVYQNAVAR